jgi:hypothetical protein
MRIPFTERISRAFWGNHKANSKGRPAVKKHNAVVLARKSQTIDLEYCMFKIVEGKTYEDDGTTIFDVYINAGLQDGSFETAAPRPDTILVHHPEG